MSKSIAVKDPVSGGTLHLSAKSFLRGGLVGDDPIVALVLSSSEGELIGHFVVRPEDAHVFSEYLRQEAELASVIEAEDSAGQKKEEDQA